MKTELTPPPRIKDLLDKYDHIAEHAEANPGYIYPYCMGAIKAFAFYDVATPNNRVERIKEVLELTEYLLGIEVQS